MALSASGFTLTNHCFETSGSTGVLQRWAYVSYFSVCEPGQEDATFARMEKLIAASVPAFQLPPAGH